MVIHVGSIKLIQLINDKLRRIIRQFFGCTVSTVVLMSRWPIVLDVNAGIIPHISKLAKKLMVAK